MSNIIGIDLSVPNGDRTVFYTREKITGVLGIGKSMREAEENCMHQIKILKQKNNESNNESGK